jgi:hypothetical protein
VPPPFEQASEKLFLRPPQIGFDTTRVHHNRMLKKAVQQGPRERSPRSVLQYVRRLRDRETPLAAFFSILLRLAIAEIRNFPGIDLADFVDIGRR